MTVAGVSVGLKALIAAQSSLDTIGNNLANINTPGYSRQRVELAQSLGVMRYGLRIGSGVDALGVSRAVDNLLEARILTQLGVRGQLAERFAAAQEIEFTLGEFDGSGVGSAMDDYFAAAKQLSTSPADSILRTNLVQGGIQVAERFNQVQAGLGNLSGSAVESIAGAVEQVNALAKQIAIYNGQIQSIEPGGQAANQLRDQRQEAVKALSSLAQVEVREDKNGSYRVYLEGNLLVAGDRPLKLQRELDGQGKASLRLEGAGFKIQPRSGQLSALLALQDNDIAGLSSGLDELAKGLIYAVNSAHSTGIPSGGGYSSLVGTNGLVDLDGDGQLGDQLLSQSGLPFDVVAGELTVNVVDEASGGLEIHVLSIDPESTTVDDFLGALNAIEGLSAGLNAEGQITIDTDSGKRFDFSSRLDTDPAAAGTLGGGKAKLGSEVSGPFNLSAGGDLQFAVPAGGPGGVSIAIDPGAFENAAKVSASELAAYFNADAGFQTAGLEAHEVGGYLQFTSAASGADQSFELTGGSAAASLGLSAAIGQPVTGTDLPAEVTILGAYTGAENQSFLFEVSGDGKVGTTPGLALKVFDNNGALVATLNIGEGYQAGTPLAVADGIEVSIGLGDLSGSNHERFDLDARADSDSSDALVALGLGGFFVGFDAQTIAVNSNIVKNADNIATSWSGTSSGNQALIALGAIQDTPLESLGGSTLSGRYGELVAGLGFDLATMGTSLDTSEKVLESLQTRRDAVSGVNADEELVDLTRFQQAYATAAQFLSVVTRLQDELLAIL